MSRDVIMAATEAGISGNGHDKDALDGRDASSEGDGDVLDAVLAWLERFVAYPSDEAAIAHALWIAHTHAMDAWYSTPRIAFLSPEPASGKTRALEVTQPLVPNPIQAVNVTPAYLFRKVGEASEEE